MAEALDFVAARPIAGERPTFPNLPASWKKPGDVLHARPAPGQRLSTGVPAIDNATRGGFCVGTVATFQGPPGVGKTTLAMQIAQHLQAEHGAVVVALLPDEGTEPSAVRYGQGLGFSRERLEAGETEEVIAFDAKTSTAPVWFPDPDEPENTLEAVLGIVAKLAAWHEGPIVFVGDSTQTLRLAAALDSESPRARVEAIMLALRRAAKTTPLLVLNVAQVNRGRYRNKKDGENANPLAAAAESRAIEYGSDTLFDLEGQPEEFITVQTPKNRGGSKPTFRLKLDPARALFLPIDEGAAEAEAQEAARIEAESEWSRDEQRVLEGLRRHPGKSKRALAALLQMRPQRLAAVLEELHRKKKAEFENLKRGAESWHLTASRSEADK